MKHYKEKQFSCLSNQQNSSNIFNKKITIKHLKKYNKIIENNMYLRF